MLSFVPGFQKFPEVEINLLSSHDRKYFLNKETGEKLLIFSDNEDISGEISIKLKESSSFEHSGIHIELVGIINSKNDDFYKSEFLNMNKELESPGDLAKSMNYNFSFKKVNLPYESYNGSIVAIRYFVRVTITKKIFGTKLAIEKEFMVYNPIPPPELNANIRMEVGIGNMIHLEYELFQSKFHLDECVIGKIYFIDVLMRVRGIEVHLIKVESIGSGVNKKLDTDLIYKFEIVDGCPEANEVVPVRMFINSYETLSPTYRDVNNMVSVKYYLKFVVVSEDDKSFFKQQEISLWRKTIN